jgi:GNAT superfamily N-acetyltransferase
LCKARGLTPHPRTWAKFIRGAEPFAARTDLLVREIGLDHADAFGEVTTKGFGMPPFVAPWLAALVGRPRWRCFLAFDGDAPVGAGAAYIDKPAAWLGIGATLPSHRGRGAQGAILAARIDAAVRDGCTVLTTETGIPHDSEAGPSFKNIQRAGFRVAYARPNLRRAAPAG